MAALWPHSAATAPPLRGRVVLRAAEVPGNRPGLCCATALAQELYIDPLLHPGTVGGWRVPERASLMCTNPAQHARVATKDTSRPQPQQATVYVALDS